MPEDSYENLHEEATNAILKQIAKKAGTASPESLLSLAEAFAWVTMPNQPHG